MIHLHCSPESIVVTAALSLLYSLKGHDSITCQKEMVSLLTEYLTCHVALEIFVKQYLEVDRIWRDLNRSMLKNYLQTLLGPYF